MAALTTGRRTPFQANPTTFIEIPMAASTTLFKGGVVCKNSSGYAVPGAVSTTLKAIGILVDQNDGLPVESITNSGANGAVTVRVARGIALLNNGTTAITQADVGSLCYLTDDNTVASDNGGATRSACGRIIGLEPSTGPSGAGVWVDIGNVAAP